MAGIDYPLWYTLKANIATALEAIATEEALVSSGRAFTVSNSRWFPWIESQQNTALVNVMVQNVGPNTERSASRKNRLDQINVFVDMYAIGKAGEILPADEIAAARLDLLTAQVREGLTRLKNAYFGFSKDSDFGHIIDTGSSNFTLTVYDQDGQKSSMQYAPARWTFTVEMPYIPTDNNDYVDLEELNVSVSDDTLELFATLFDYTT